MVTVSIPDADVRGGVEVCCRQVSPWDTQQEEFLDLFDLPLTGLESGLCHSQLNTVMLHVRQPTPRSSHSGQHQTYLVMHSLHLWILRILPSHAVF